MLAIYAIFALLCNLWLADAKWPLDCDEVDVKSLGPLNETIWFNDTADGGTLIFVLHPPLTQHAPYPVIVFSHGSTGEYAMYETAIQHYVSHGFVVVFPHIKGPQKDTGKFTLDPMGDFTIKGVHYATAANSNPSSPLYKMLDLSNLVLAGHSMGASSTIMASKRLPAGTVKAAYALHPGICGPFGPPPCIKPFGCSTWMPADFKEASRKMPVILSTATNDAAFWPAPSTAKHEFGCYNKSLDILSKGNAFVQFSADACQEDGTGGRFDRKWPTGGHDCPMKHPSVETQWVLVTAKLYAQFNGNDSSHCHKMLWGDGPDSLVKDPAVEKYRIDAKAKEIERVAVIV